MKYAIEYFEMHVVRDWYETFALLPKKTVSGKWIWLKEIYCKHVWAVYGEQRFHMEPERFYGTLFDVLKEQYDR